MDVLGGRLQRGESALNLGIELTLPREGKNTP
jgi:hypothetical protein